MKKNALLVIATIFAAIALVGCGSSGPGGDTKDAAAEVQKAAAQGGPEPNPNLPKPMGGGPGVGSKPAGK